MTTAAIRFDASASSASFRSKHVLPQHAYLTGQLAAGLLGAASSGSKSCSSSRTWPVALRAVALAAARCNMDVEHHM